MRCIMWPAAAAALVLAASTIAAAQTAAGRAASPAAPAAKPSGDALAVARADRNLSTFVALAEQAGLVTTLSSPGPVTVLAPDNAAFAKLSAAQLAELQKPENAARLQRVLLYHIIPGAAPARALTGVAGPVETAAQVKVRIDGTGPAVKVDNATITRPDIVAANGTIHIIDSVLMPAG